MMVRVMFEESAISGAVQLAVAGYRKPDTQFPSVESVHDLGMLPFEDVPVLLNSLDVAIVYNRRSSFGDYCFPQKFYEMLACRVPIVAANVGEMGLLLAGDQHLLYEDGDVASLALAIQRQLKERRLPDLRIPTWQEQAGLLLDQMASVLASERA
jgi:glycosyltransferase involved in cell wall biosynthesis